MDTLKHGSTLAAAIAPALADAPFMLVDVGCAGGLGRGWRSFEPNLRAVGFDPSIPECARLAAAETNPNVRYEPAYVGPPPGLALTERRGARPVWGRNPWDRLSAARSQALREARAAAAGLEPVADPDAPVDLGAYFEEHALASIDFIKIDVDGLDFDILVGLEAELERRDVLGVGVEVNFFGTAADTDHTFHNVDRFMKAQGFELFDLSVRRYSAAALPHRYLLAEPAQTEHGRPFQGDAIYLRDLAADENTTIARRLGPAKLLKLAATFELFKLADCAAEILVRRGPAIAAAGVDPRPLLDLLAKERGAPLGLTGDYASYLARFEADDAAFYPGPTPG